MRFPQLAVADSDRRRGDECSRLLTLIPLIERNPDPPLPAPGDVAWSLQLLALHDQGEVVRDEEGGHHLERRSGL